MWRIASTPVAGSEPCAATPCVSTSSQAKPLCATATARFVGSPTIAASARRPLATTASVPRLRYSSSATAVRITSFASPSRTAAAAAIIQAASAPLVSQAPRP